MWHWIGTPGQARSLSDLQLDIVGFLAILGEGSVLANAQVSTLSKWVFLPRLLPAPQALMRPTRPNKLEPAAGWVTGVFSGNHKDSINYIGNIVCDASGLPEHSVRVVSIERIERKHAANAVKSKTVAPLTAVLFLGFFLSVGLLVLSIIREDAMSLLATALLSLLSSLIGWGNKWTLKLPERKIKNDKVPKGDVVIRYPKGSFLVVRCEEEVARELYFAPESIKYQLEHGPAYRVLSLVGTMMLMGGVICLANAQIELQIAWAASYMLLGASYWIVAALPTKVHWDYSCYKVTNETLSLEESDLKVKGWPSANEAFTEALWKTIVVTKSTKWVKRGEAAPDTEAWNDWLTTALEMAKTTQPDKRYVKGQGEVTYWEVPKWDARGYLIKVLADQASSDEKSITTEGVEEV